jgi:hypothetical protein
MCVCMCVCVCVYVFVCVCVCARARVYVYIYIQSGGQVSMCGRAVCLYINNKRVCVYVCVYSFIYKYRAAGGYRSGAADSAW